MQPYGASEPYLEDLREGHCERHIRLVTSVVGSSGADGDGKYDGVHLFYRRRGAYLPYSQVSQHEAYVWGELDTAVSYLKTADCRRQLKVTETLLQPYTADAIIQSFCHHTIITHIPAPTIRG